MQGDDPVVSFMDRDDWKISSVFNLKREPMALGPGDSVLTANITYPRAGTYHDIRLYGRYLRGMDPIKKGRRLAQCLHLSGTTYVKIPHWTFQAIDVQHREVSF